MNTTMQIIEDFLHHHRITIYGTCSQDKVTGNRLGYGPSDMLPLAKSVLCIGIPFPKGIYQHPKNLAMSYWWNSNLYFDMIDSLMTRLAAMIETAGHLAAPVNGCFPLDFNFAGEMMGYTNMIQMGVATKIGTKGKNGLLFHSVHGPRLILGGIVTSAELPEITMPREEATPCPETCSICRDNCPAGAIDSQGNIDIPRCWMHASKNVTNLPGRILFKGIVPILSALKLMKKETIFPKKMMQLTNLTYANTHGMFTCINCVSMCPYPAFDPA